MASSLYEPAKSSPGASFRSSTLPRRGPIKSLSEHRYTHSANDDPFDDYWSLPRSPSGSMGGLDRYSRHYSIQPSPGRKFLSKLNLTDDSESVFNDTPDHSFETKFHFPQKNEHHTSLPHRITFSDQNEYINYQREETEDLPSDSLLTPQEESFLPLVTHLQSICRGYLSRKRLKKRKERKQMLENQMNNFNDHYEEPQLENFLKDTSMKVNVQAAKYLNRQNEDTLSQEDFYTEETEINDEKMCPNCSKQFDRRSRLDSTDSDNDLVGELTLKLKKTQRDLDYYKAQVEYLMVNDNEEVEKLKKELEEFKTTHDKEIEEMQEQLRIERKRCRDQSYLIEDLQSKVRIYSKKRDETDSKSKRRSTDLIKLESKLKETEDMLQLVSKEKDKLNAKYMIIEMELNDSKEENVTLNRQISELNSELSSKSADTSSLSPGSPLSGKLKHFEQECARLQEQCDSYEDTIADLRQQLLEAEDRHRAVTENSLFKLKSQLAREKREAQIELEDSNEKLYKQVKELKKNVEELNEELENRENLITEMDLKLAELTEDMEDRETSSRFKEDTEQLKKEVRYLKTKLEESEKSLHEMQEDKDDKDSSKIRSLKNTIADLEKQNAALSSERLQLKIKCYNMNTAVDDGESRAKLLTKEKNSLQNKLNTSKSEIRKLEASLAEYEKQKSNDRVQISSLNRQIKEFTNENAELKEEIRKLKSERSKELSTNASDLRSQAPLSSTNSAVSRLERKVKELEKRKEHLEEEIQLEGSRFQEEINNLKIDLQESTVREDAEKAKVRKLKQDIIDLEDQLDKNKKLATSANRNALDIQGELDMAKCEIKALKKKLEQQQSVGLGKSSNMGSNSKSGNDSDYDTHDTQNGGTVDDSETMEKCGALPKHKDLLSKADALLAAKQSNSAGSSSASLYRRKKFNK